MNSCGFATASVTSAVLTHRHFRRKHAAQKHTYRCSRLQIEVAVQEANTDLWKRHRIITCGEETAIISHGPDRSHLRELESPSGGGSMPDGSFKPARGIIATFHILSSSRGCDSIRNCLCDTVDNTIKSTYACCLLVRTSSCGAVRCSEQAVRRRT